MRRGDSETAITVNAVLMRMPEMEAAIMRLMDMVASEAEQRQRQQQRARASDPRDDTPKALSPIQHSMPNTDQAPLPELGSTNHHRRQHNRQTPILTIAKVDLEVVNVLLKKMVTRYNKTINILEKEARKHKDAMERLAEVNKGQEREIASPKESLRRIKGRQQWTTRGDYQVAGDGEEEEDGVMGVDSDWRTWERHSPFRGHLARCHFDEGMKERYETEIAVLRDRFSECHSTLVKLQNERTQQA